MELGSQRDIDITVKMYERWPKFGDEEVGPPFRFYMREVDMGNDRELFEGDSTGLPVYEGRMVDLFDHRAKGYRSGRGRAAVWEELPFGQSGKSIQPQWYIAPSRIPEKTAERVQRYRIGFCDVASATNVRSLVATIIPPNFICGHKIPTITFHSQPIEVYAPEAAYEWAYPVWTCVANSFVMDFLVRKKVSLSMTYTILDSLPFPRLTPDHELTRKLLPLGLRLTCTSPEMAGFWDAMAEQGWVDPIAEGSTPPGFTDPELRLDARAQIDAIVAKEIYGLSRDEVDYVLETFRIAKEYDIDKYGDYRTKMLILEHYDAMPVGPGVVTLTRPSKEPLQRRSERNTVGLVELPQTCTHDALIGAIDQTASALSSSSIVALHLPDGCFVAPCAMALLGRLGAPPPRAGHPPPSRR